MKPGLIVLIALGGVIVTAGTFIAIVGLSNRNSDSAATNTHVIEQAYGGIDFTLGTSDLDFYLSSDGSTKVVCKESEKLKNEVSVVDGVLTVKSVDSRQWYESIFSWGIERRVSVYLPSAAYGDLKIVASTGNVDIPSDFGFNTANIRVSTGSITFKSNVAETAKFVASTGSINLSDMKVTTLDVESSTGSTTVKNVDVFGKAHFEASTGSFRATDLHADTLEIKRSTGTTELTNVLVDNNLTIKASTGDVTFRDCDADTLDIETSTGDVRGTLLTDKIFSVKTDTGHVSVPTSTTGGLCKIKTNTGDIEISIKGK